MPKSSCSGLIPQDLTGTGCAAFTKICNMLLDCVPLTRLHLTIAEHYLFHGEQTALENVLLHDKAVDSQGLRNFQKLLQSLPQLQVTDINACRLIDGAWNIPSEDVTPFIGYALTGWHRLKLWVMIRVILEQKKLQANGSQVNVILHIDLGVLPSEGEVLEDYEQRLTTLEPESEESKLEIPQQRPKMKLAKRYKLGLLYYKHRTSIGE
ncbi:hypothetical protein DE146DRAFT_391650 [Phaeosphaeria sp. MPI-PUGE-AT-0046c]|nr:hypothetical protein DE146DRAFT_391650 [Phaeosphaeria sp. MPI-PUGE-AT-0046c]